MDYTMGKILLALQLASSVGLIAGRKPSMRTLPAFWWAATDGDEAINHSLLLLLTDLLLENLTEYDFFTGDDE